MARLYLLRGRIFYEDSDKLSLVNGAIHNSTTAAAGGKTVNAGAGALTIAAQAATIIKTATIAAGAGALLIAAQNATVTKTHTVGAGSGQLVVAAQGATVTKNHSVAAGAGSLAIAAQGATITKGKQVSAGSGSLLVAAQSATITKTRTVDAGAGALTIAAQNATIGASKQVDAGSGALTVAAQGATVTKTRTIEARTQHGANLWLDPNVQTPGFYDSTAARWTATTGALQYRNPVDDPTAETYVALLNAFLNTQNGSMYRVRVTLANVINEGTFTSKISLWVGYNGEGETNITPTNGVHEFAGISDSPGSNSDIWIGGSKVVTGDRLEFDVTKVEVFREGHWIEAQAAAITQDHVVTAHGKEALVDPLLTNEVDWTTEGAGWTFDGPGYSYDGTGTAPVTLLAVDNSGIIEGRKYDIRIHTPAMTSTWAFFLNGTFNFMLTGSDHSFDGIVAGAQSNQTRLIPSAPTATIELDFVHVYDSETGVLVAAQGATITRHHRVDAGSGAITIAAQNAVIETTPTKTIDAGSGSLVVAAQNATITQHREIDAGAGAIIIAAQPATISKTKVVTAGAGALVVAAQNATLNIGKNVTAGSGALVVAAQPATIQKAHTINAGSGALVIAAQPADVTKGVFVPDGVTRTPGRTWTIAAEDRTWSIAEEDRTFTSG